jgi:hypothetical protein
VRIGGVVHVRTVLPPGTTVPIGWVAVGDPVRICPPGQHEQIWEVQESLDFPGTVYGLPRDAPAAERMSRQSAWFAAHLSDRIIDDSPPENDLTPAGARSVVAEAAPGISTAHLRHHSGAAIRRRQGSADGRHPR